MNKKILCTLMSITLIATTLTGCNFDFSKKPKTAIEVIEKYEEKEEKDNMNLEGSLTVELEIDTQGLNLNVPISLNLDMDIAKENMHGEMEMEASFMGEEVNESAEIYVNEDKTYTYDKNVGYWVVSESEFEGINNSFEASAFENAELIIDKENGTYIVKQSFKEFMNNDSFKDMFKSTTSMTESFDVDKDDIIDALEETSVTYIFDKEYNLLNIKLEGCEYEQTIEEDGTEYTISISIEFDFNFSKFGEIDEDDVIVPKSVKKEAIDESDETEIPTSSINIEEEPSSEIEEIEIIETSPVEIIEPVETIPEQAVVEPLPDENIALSCPLGSYNNMELNGNGTSWDETFGKDGWVFDNEDGEYSFMTCINDKYEDCSLYVYNADRSNVTKDDILNNGVFGYSIDVSFCEGTKPAMSWNGLTWGSSAEDIINAYGTPDYSYEGSMYTTYEYYITDKIELAFYVYENGIQQVELDVFNF